MNQDQRSTAFDAAQRVWRALGDMPEVEVWRFTDSAGGRRNKVILMIGEAGACVGGVTVAMP
jgi:hypothetical protein